MIEEWRDIPNYEGLYQISNFGLVKSLNKTILTKNKKLLKYKEKILKTYNRDGYLYIKLCKEGKYKTYKISRLVLTLFNRPAKLNEDACHFPDKNLLNNRIDNLIWGTRKENINHAKKHGTCLYGENTNNSKLTSKEVIEIRKLRQFKSAKEIAKIYKVTPATIQRIISRKIWKHV